MTFEPDDERAEVPESDSSEPASGEFDSTTGIPDGEHRELAFPVVGIGASAGGLEAFKELLSALPGDTGMAFVLVPHLSPTHESMMAEILTRSAAMPVLEVADEPHVEPNTVYVIPPARSMVIEGGRLRLSPRPRDRSANHAIDLFLSSLAEDQTYTAIGVILSGTGHDGTAGVKQIKDLGGITFAQDATAAYDGMPRSAIDTGCVDFVLSPGEIAAELARIAKHPYASPQPEAAAAPIGDNTDLDAILQLLFQASGVDFTHYKRSTLGRRIARRIVLDRVNSLHEYVERLTGNRAEVDALYHDILINVTSFFRNPDAFDALKAKVFPHLVRDRERNDPIRVWALGCSTGEEAYSLAIALTEFAESIGRNFPVQIFATDLNARGIEKARAGIYPLAIAEDVSPDRLRRFFVESDGAYRVSKQIRAMCIFAQHNGLTDPPFSRIDLVSCRNMLIYLDKPLQRRLIPWLHYALKPEGYLWLGTSETIGAYRSCFALEDARFRIYAKQPGLQRLPGSPAPLGSRPRSRATSHGTPLLVPDPALQALDTTREADRILLTRFTPAAVLVNAALEIVQFRGDTSPYLLHVSGKASLQLLKMLREGLLVGVRGALARTQRGDQAPARETGLRVRSEDGYRTVDVEVIPVKGAGRDDDCYLVLFEQRDGTRRPEPRPDAAAESSKSDHQEVDRLSQELGATKDYLQSVIEHHEAANEELQSANEEIQSSNEELQSINEELETSKEEIQSSNEELATVNEELHNRNLEISQSSNDLLNLLTSVQIPIVMLGPDLRIRRFTPAAQQLLNLIAADVGRPITDIQLNVQLPDLATMMVDVMQTMHATELETRDRDGHWFSVRLRPYRTTDNRIDGVVVALVDIDSVKQAEQAVRESEARFRLLADRAPVLIWMSDQTGIQFVNRAFTDFVGADAPEVRGHRWRQFLHPDDRDEYVAAFERAFADRRDFDGQYRVQRRDGDYRWMKVVASPRELPGSNTNGYVGSMVDVTDLKTAEASLRRADRAKNDFLAMLAHELRNPLAPIQNVVEVLKTASGDEPTVRWGRDVLERQVRAMARMVDDLLDVSRITHGHIQLQRDTVDMREVVQRSIELLAHVARSREQALTVSLPTEPALVDGDALRLQQAIGNLLHNAIKFTPPGGHIRVTGVLLPAADDAMAKFELRIRDDGVGIEAAMLAQVFDPFMQLKQSLDRSQGGLGIGLTLVRTLVAMHAGTVSVTSDGAGKGTEFTLTLPTVESTPAQPRDETPPSLAGPGRRVLLVDDNIDGSEALATLLERAGHAVAVLHDGNDVLQQATQFRPDAVILDIGLPGVSGYDVARQLRQHPDTARTLLLAVTGYSSADARQRTADAGFDAHYVKPMDFGVLMGLLSRDPLREP